MKEKSFELKAAKGMITSICTGYASREEIDNVFKNFDKSKEFTGEELKALVKELTRGKNKQVTRRKSDITKFVRSDKKTKENDDISR